MKKINFFSVALLLIVFALETSAQTFTFEPTTGVITGLDASNPNPTDVTIPDEISSVKVRGIGKDAFNGKTSITSLVFNTTQLDSIGMGSFRGCTGLTSIAIPASVTRIGYWAFQNCGNVTSLSFTAPASLTYIGQGSFEAMTKLTSIEIPNTVTTIIPYAFYNCTGLTSVTLPNAISSISDNVFQHCTGLSSITIPNSVTSIGAYSFYQNTSLASITIPNNVTIVKNNAFDGCTNLAALDFQPTSKLSTIGNYAFQSCKIATLSLPASVSAIGNFAFKANAFTNVDLNAVTSIGAVAFQYCNSLTAITIPNTVSSLGDYAFDGCVNLNNVTFSTGSILTSIGQHVFSSIKIASVSIPNSVTNIDKWAFGFCPQLTNATLSNSLLTIQQGAFEGSGLTSVVIPASVTSIGDYAFYNSANLAQVRVLKGDLPLTAIGNGSFQNTSSSLSILVPATVVNDYKAAWIPYANKIVADTTTSLKSNFDDNILVSQNPSTNYLTIKRALGANVQIVNMAGQPISQMKNLAENIDINTASWKSGCYVVIIDNGTTRKCIKIIK